MYIRISIYTFQLWHESSQPEDALQPKASQRAIGDLMGVSKDSVARDLGERESGAFAPKVEISTLDNGANAPPAIPPDDYDPIKDERSPLIKPRLRHVIISKCVLHNTHFKVLID